ncbi:MAG: bifunctional 2-polyprenyl-6-hydroxyphenol methylase/3-demethylubiquinol 3-O-methyltransferase UbiG [Pseudomonadota bacterium]
MTGTPQPAPSGPKSSVSADELARFSAIAEEWWDPDGKFKPLHRLNPVRLDYIRSRLCDHFQRDRRGSGALEGLRLLDIGCGGGLLAEPLARQGAQVTAIDPSEQTIGIARAHARQTGVAVDYRATTAEALLAEGAHFDCVTALEVVEHVTDVPAFVATCSALVAPNGVFIGSTLNRTLKSYALAIVGAERVLRWLPVGTHDFQKFVRPAEFEKALQAGGLSAFDRAGIVYDPLSGGWRLSARDLDVNYLIAARR